MNSMTTQTADKDSISPFFVSQDNKLNSKLEEVIKGEIWLIHNALTAKQCKSIIEYTEKKGYEQALLNVGYGKGIIDTDVRDSSRVMIDDFECANGLKEQIRQFVPLCQEGAIYCGMNERFRILKYTKKQKFALHMDGLWSPSPTVRSILTIQYYLNKVPKGGATRFEWQGWPNGEFNCFPTEGKAVIFRQRGWWHEGCPVEEGLKYTVRNDLMYQDLFEKEWQSMKEKENLTCGMCKQQPKSEKLKCGHLFLFCGCKPFNQVFKTTGRNGQKLRCQVCDTLIIKVSDQLDKLL